MDLNTLWFILVAVLFTGYFFLEGFDFGVGMLLPILGKNKKERNAIMKTIGPVWDGNEVWLITGGGALFAAFPNWYATLFSGLYIPLFLMLLALIFRGVAIEYRLKIDNPTWEKWCDVGIGIGSWIPAILWGVAFANIVGGLPVGPNMHLEATFGNFIGLLNWYGLLGGIAFCILFLLHGATFIQLKTAGIVRLKAINAARKLIIPTAVIVATFGIATQVLYGKGWTWIPLLLAVAGLLTVLWAIFNGRDGWAFGGTFLTIVGAGALLFGSLFPDLIPSTVDAAYSVDIYNGASTPYTLRVMTIVAAFGVPIVLLYQAWTYWVFRKRVTAGVSPEELLEEVKEYAETQ